MTLRARSGTNGGHRILADRGLYAAALDGQAPFAYAHERNIFRQRVDCFFRPRLGPAPVPCDELLIAVGLLYAAMDNPVHFREYFICGTLPATRTLRAVVVRPAICEIFGCGNREEARQVANGAADRCDRVAQPLLHFRHTGAKRGVIGFSYSFEFWMGFKETNRHRTRFVEVQVNAHAIFSAASDQAPQALESFQVTLANSTVVRERREL